MLKQRRFKIITEGYSFISKSFTVTVNSSHSNNVVTITVTVISHRKMSQSHKYVTIAAVLLCKNVCLYFVISVIFTTFPLSVFRVVY